MTAHELARALLAGEDLPIYHFDPSYAGLDDEWDDSCTDPVVETVEVPHTDENGEEISTSHRFIAIIGTQDL